MFPDVTVISSLAALTISPCMLSSSPRNRLSAPASEFLIK